jgi:hypothetical protein
LREHPETLAKIETAVRARANLIKTAASSDSESSSEESGVKSLPGATQVLPSSQSTPAKTGRRGAGATATAE